MRWCKQASGTQFCLWENSLYKGKSECIGLRKTKPDQSSRFHSFLTIPLSPFEICTVSHQSLGTFYRNQLWFFFFFFFIYFTSEVYFFFFFLFFLFFFVIHWNETSLSLHVFPIPIPPPTSLSTRSLQVLPEYQVRALVSCILPGLVICFWKIFWVSSWLFADEFPFKNDEEINILV